MKAAERAHSLATSHALFARILAVPCPNHDASPGVGCWRLGDHPAACGARALSADLPVFEPPPLPPVLAALHAARAAETDAETRDQHRHPNRHHLRETA